MHIDVNFKQWYIKYQSTFIFSSYKTIAMEKKSNNCMPQ